jgi:ATP-dependent helicase/nuclease subunit A
MQYLDFSRVSSAEEIRAQLEEMVQNAFLTVRQAEAVAPEKLFAVFACPLGELIRGADRVIREFKFSVLVDASAYFPGGEGEKLLLQGVTDCCLISGDGLTVVDFKTDRIRPGAEAKAAEGYRPQLDAYSLALQRIFGLPVRRKLLYFFATDTLTDVE